MSLLIVVRTWVSKDEVMLVPKTPHLDWKKKNNEMSDLFSEVLTYTFTINYAGYSRALMFKVQLFFNNVETFSSHPLWSI